MTPQIFFRDILFADNTGEAQELFKRNFSKENQFLCLTMTVFFMELNFKDIHMLNYEITDATKQLTIARSLNGYTAPFKLIGGYRLIDNGIEPEATIQIEALGKTIHEASNGNGPVDALANVLKKGLTPLFPCLENITLVDYSAKILDSSSGTGTTVLVEITFTDKTKAWKVYASSANINAASFQVIVDGFEYAILNSVR